MAGAIIKIGPFGGKYGTTWDGKGHANIVQIFVSHQSSSINRINSIQYQYVENGNLKLSELFGSLSYGYKYDCVKLNYPTEYITWIRGYIDCKLRISSITFGTNLGEYGPFGKYVETQDTEFSVKLGENQFFGFHGYTVDGCVGSIGVYMKPNMTLDPAVRERIN